MGAGSSAKAPKEQTGKGHDNGYKAKTGTLNDGTNDECDMGREKKACEQDEDCKSIDSANSDDTLSVFYCKMPKYEAVHQPEMHDDIIEIIAKENETTYASNSDDDKQGHTGEGAGKEGGLQEGNNGGSRPPTRLTFEIDTIGYYVSKSNREANEQLHKETKEKQENAPTDKDAVRNESESEPMDTNKLYEEFKHNYSSRSKLVKKRTLANKQTLVLAKVGNRYKYVTVPAYLPGQQLYSSRSIAKNYMTSPQYVYKRGKQKDAANDCLA